MTKNDYLICMALLDRIENEFQKAIDGIEEKRIV